MYLDQSIEYDSSASESSDSDDDIGDGAKVRYPSKPAQMSFYHRQCFENKLRAITTFRGDIAEGMIFCIRHAYAAEEITDLISQSLLLNETIIYPTKIARLYLISDILLK